MKEKINPKIIAVFALCLISVILAYGYNTYTKASEMEKSAVFNIPQMVDDIYNYNLDKSQGDVTPVVSKYIPIGSEKAKIEKELKDNDFTLYNPKGLARQNFEYDEMFGAERILVQATEKKPIGASFVTFYFFDKKKLVSINAHVHIDAP